MNKKLKKELIDQSAHFIVGLVLVIIFSFVFSEITSCIIIFTFAYFREVVQRINNGDPWHKCSSGCLLDLSFWGLGIITGAGISNLI